MSQTVGFLVDLSGIALADSGPTWIQALPLGTYLHPVYGEIKITPDRVQKFAANVTAKVIDKQPDIDYDHKKRTDHAAGWVEAAEARPDGLWIQVDWTPKARQMLKDKEYKYFSPEFIDEWKHPKSQAVHQDVLLGGALTNRPFLKDILPINLSEVFENAHKEGGSMPAGLKKLSADDAMKELAKKHGLDPETATPEEIVAAVEAAKTAEPPDDDKTKTDPPVTEPVKTPEPETLSARLSDDQRKDPFLVKLAEVADTQAKQLAEATKTIQVLSTANRMADVDAKLLQLSDDVNGAKIVLAPAQREVAREILLALPAEQGRKYLEQLAVVTQGKATVQLGEVGGMQGGSGNGGNATKAFPDAAAKAMSEKKLSYVDAVEHVARTEPKLFTDYQ